MYEARHDTERRKKLSIITRARLYILLLLMVWAFYLGILEEIIKRLEKYPLITSYLSIGLGLLFSGGLFYLYWQALQIEPDFPFVAFPVADFFLSTHSFMFVAGALTWLIGTLLFFFEIFGYITFYISDNVGIKDWFRRDIAVVVVSALLYGSLRKAIGDVEIIPGFSLRPAYIIVPLLGIFFGTPGAIGVALGSLFKDILSGDLGVGSFGRLISDFLGAYILYKSVKDPSFSNVKSLGEFYIWGVVVQPIVTTIYRAWWLEFLFKIEGSVFEAEDVIIFAWALYSPLILLENVFINAFIVPVLGFILYPQVKALGLPWRDRAGVSKLYKEYKDLLEESNRIKIYLNKLETLRTEGMISETTYAQLKEEYSNKLTLLEAKIKEHEEEIKKVEGSRVS
jgi:energy-coupling factor transport system substrate-specific component